MQIEKKVEAVKGPSVAHVCPHCRRHVLFQAIGDDLKISDKYRCGQRVCPHCMGHVFVAFEWDALWRAYPPLTTDFDTTDVPEMIVETFNEALTCQAQSCFTAAAIMIRRTLEEICAERGAKGKDLKDRIAALRNLVTLPNELFEAMDELRLLGNDAAHIEAKSYDDVGSKELTVAAMFTKEILKGVYQYKSLLTALRELKKDATKPTTKA